ncbi:hypothetical protein N7468_001727 [Penicillium chermesinum]|uniref:Uncharacterized protein n=1 Tax=Penicillium chermesinum TaxID=63820 RepID=A0A9W9TYX3_9EURO|nr:uncharacterized protein N7468_001727 [Penicillium chermesinum]KAJ5246744.1 hypothetical protein N7468_001727 [Penicillium chermesinum]
MVELTAVHASNKALRRYLRPKAVAVFVGATKGIGKTSLLNYAKHAPQPRIYFIGRSQQAADGILKQLREESPEGNYTFIKADASLLNKVDEICEELKAKEENISLLFQSQGTLDMSTKTSENLMLITALGYYSRMRFIANLLPLLRKSPSVSRVISVLAGTKEGPLDMKDLSGSSIAPWKARGHISSLSTLTLEHFAETAPDVSFIYSYPGFVDTDLAQTMKGILPAVFKVGFAMYRTIGPKITYMPLDETGERYTFLATSSRFPSQNQSKDPPNYGKDIAVGSDGAIGSGVYTLDEFCESGDAKVQEVLAELRLADAGAKVWQHLQEVFKNVTGKESIW